MFVYELQGHITHSSTRNLSFFFYFKVILYQSVAVFRKHITSLFTVSTWTLRHQSRRWEQWLPAKSQRQTTKID